MHHWAVAEVAEGLAAGSSRYVSILSSLRANCWDCGSGSWLDGRSILCLLIWRAIFFIHSTKEGTSSYLHVREILSNGKGNGMNWNGMEQEMILKILRSVENMSWCDCGS